MAGAKLLWGLKFRGLLFQLLLSYCVLGVFVPSGWAVHQGEGVSRVSSKRGQNEMLSNELAKKYRILLEKRDRGKCQRICRIHRNPP